MAGLLPLVNSVGCCQYPVTRRITYVTDVATAADATEQRARFRPPLTEISLPYTRVNATDLAAFQAWFRSQKGSFDSSWGVVLGRASLDGAISASGTTLTCASGPFRSSDTGQTFVVSGAGAAGGLLVATGTYVSATQVTLSVAASTTVSGADTRWGIYLPNMTLTDDQFIAEESYTTYSFTIRARQTTNPGQASSGTGGTFPTLANGAPTQFPYQQFQRFAVLVADSPSGIRYSWNFFDGSASFPNGALHGWQVGGPALSNADLATLETFARNQWGRYGTFTFVDPDSLASFAKCRLDSDVIEVVHQDFNRNSLTLRVMETN